MVTAKYLIGTDWIVFYLRGREPYVSTLKRLQEEGLAVSGISVAELYEGVFRGQNPQTREEGLARFLAGVVVVDVNKDVAKIFGQLRAELRQQGLTVADLGLLIGSTAVRYGLLLLTDNRRHYEKIPGLRLAGPVS